MKRKSEVLRVEKKNGKGNWTQLDKGKTSDRMTLNLKDNLT